MSNSNILIVDDNDNNLLVLESVLEKMQVNIIKASSGEQALKILLDQEVSIILLDVKMPGMDGFETAELIRKKPKTRNLPIIFLSGSNEKDFKKFSEKYPENVDFIYKPININRVRELVGLHI